MVRQEGKGENAYGASHMTEHFILIRNGLGTIGIVFINHKLNYSTRGRAQIEVEG